MTLTQAEEERLLKEAERRFWGYARSMRLPSYEADDIAQECRITAWQAIKDYRPGGMSIQGYIAKRLKWRMGQLLNLYLNPRYTNKHAEMTPLDSLDEVVVENEGETIRGIDVIPGPDPWPSVNLRLALEGLALTALERFVLDGMMAGEDTGDIARRRGCSQQNVSQTKGRLRRKLADLFETS